MTPNTWLILWAIYRIAMHFGCWLMLTLCQILTKIIHSRVKASFLPIRRLREEFAELYKHLLTLNSPIVFCHNDLLLGNVIYEKSTNRITFIDYEYAGQNFQAFDIGNHFTEFAGVFGLILYKFVFYWPECCYICSRRRRHRLSALSIERIPVGMAENLLRSIQWTREISYWTRCSRSLCTNEQICFGITLFMGSMGTYSGWALNDWFRFCNVSFIVSILHTAPYCSIVCSASLKNLSCKSWNVMWWMQ